MTHCWRRWQVLVVAVLLLTPLCRGQDSPPSADPARSELAGGMTELLGKGLKQFWQQWAAASSPLVREADELAARGDYTAAADRYSLALQVHDLPVTRYRRAYCLYLLQNYDRAIDDCNLIVAANPNDGEALYLRGTCHYCAGRIKEAVAEFEALVAKGPKVANHYVALGDAYLQDQQLDKAKKSYGSALELNPKDPEIYVRRCQLLLQTNDKDGAVAEMSRLLRVDPRQTGGYVRNPTFARELTSSDLEHGRKQVEQMLKDRPEMAKNISPGDVLYEWSVRKFAGEDVPERILWNRAQPSDGALADHRTPLEGNPGEVRVRGFHPGLLGILPGKKLTCDELWAFVTYELHNVQSSARFIEVDEMARCGQLTREGYITEMARTEYYALLRCRAFYLDVYYPWAKEKQIDTNPQTWRLNMPATFSQWLASYSDLNGYPWNAYGPYYDILVDYSTRAQLNADVGKRPAISPSGVPAR